MGKRSWVEIDLSVLRNNLSIFKSLQPVGREIMAVVKADAYGHGDEKVVATLSAMGVKHSMHRTMTLRKKDQVAHGVCVLRIVSLGQGIF